MIHVLFSSALLWLGVGTALWAYLGVLAASRGRLPIMLGAVIGGVAWFFGVAVILLVGLGRRRLVEHSWPHRRTPFNEALGTPARVRVQQTYVGADPFADPFADPLPATAPGRTVAPRGTQSWAGTPVGRRKPFDRQSLLATALGVLGAALAITAFLPWGDGGVAWSHGRSHFDVGISPSDAAPVAVILVVSGLVVIGCAVGLRRDFRGTWLAGAAVVAAGWFWLISEWLAYRHDVSAVASTVNSVTGGSDGGHVTIDYGTWVAYASCLGIAVVAVTAAAHLIALRSDGRGGSWL